MNRMRPTGASLRRLLFFKVTLIAIGLYATPFGAWAQQKDSPLELGEDAMKRHDIPSALTHLTEAIQNDPKGARAYMVRGFVYLATKNYKQAISDFSTAIELDPRQTREFPNQTITYADLRNPTFFQIDTVLFDAYNGRAVAYDELGNRDMVIADETEIIRWLPKMAEDFEARLQGDTKADNHDKIPIDQFNVQWARRVLAEAYYARGKAYGFAHHYDQSISDETRSIQVMPVWCSYELRGQAYWASHEYALARGDTDRALELNPKGAPLYNSRAWIRATCPDASFRDGKGAVQDAIQACTLSAWKFPNDIDTLAAAEAEAGNFDLAVKWENQFLSMPSTDTKTLQEARDRLALFQSHKPYRDNE